MNMFSTQSVNEYLDDSTKRSKMGMGIHSNCFLESVEISKTKTGIEFMEFIFAKKDEPTYINQRIWFPNENPKAFGDETPEQALQREVNSKLAHIIKIMKCFMSEKEAEITANSFGEFCAIAKSKIEKKSFKDQPVYLKVIFDKDGIYTQFPRFPNYIQKQEEEKECKLKFSKWEKENRCTAAEVKAPEGDDPLNGMDATALPF